MKKRVVNLTRAWNVTFSDESGSNKQMTLYSNREYKITTENGTIHYVTIGNVTDDAIVPKLKVNPGFIKPIVGANNSHLKFDKITDIELVHIKYSPAKRPAFGLPEHEDRDSIELKGLEAGGKKINLTIYIDEMIGIVVKDSRPYSKNGKVTMYGHLVDYDATAHELIFDRYIASGGKRSIRKKTRVRDVDIISVFRYELTVEPFNEELAMRSEERKNATSDDDAPADAVDAPAEETQEDTGSEE